MHNLPAIIAVDLDGTLFSSDHKTITPLTYQILCDCVSKGVHLVPTTGRCESLIPLHTLPPVRYLISCNGALITDSWTGRILRAKYIPKEDVKTAWRLILEHIRGLDVVIEMFEEKQMVVERKIYDNISAYAARLPSFHLRHISSGKAKYISSFDAYLDAEGDKITKINFPGTSLRDCPGLRNALQETGMFEITSDGMNLEVTCLGCNKGESLLWLSDYLNVPCSRVVSFGDGNNDLSMLRCAGYGVAMGNATQEVQSTAPYRTASNNEDGIAHFLMKTFLPMSTMM